VADPLREAVRAHAFAEAATSDARSGAAEIARLGGEDVLAVVFFGSRKTKPSDDPWSAHDFFVLTRRYRGFYAALGGHAALARSPTLLAALNTWLPPNQLSLRLALPGGPLRAKCAVIALDTLLRETSERRRDHFCAGRLFQPAEVAWVRDEAAKCATLDALLSAHRITYDWARPWLPAEFDALDYARTLLGLSMSAEIRPEPSGRAEALVESQREYYASVYGLLLLELAGRGELLPRAGGRYALARPTRAWERARGAWFFRWSLVRATLRWVKHVLTFDDWLEYILRKAQRHSGRDIVLSERERRWPVLFLWPRLLRYLREKDQR
jgi:hypothetical protein